MLRGVSIHIKPGESVAVVGASGSGKSTILKLVTRLYDATGGAVKVNGVDVRDLTTDSLRAAVAVVPQDTVLFNDTILQNIRWDGVAVLQCCPCKCGSAKLTGVVKHAAAGLGYMEWLCPCLYTCHNRCSIKPPRKVCAVPCMNSLCAVCIAGMANRLQATTRSSMLPNSHTCTTR